MTTKHREWNERREGAQEGEGSWSWTRSKESARYE